MARAPSGNDERKARDWERALIREVDALLLRGKKPDPEQFAARWPDDADHVRTLIRLRSSLLDEGLLEPPGPAPGPEARAGDPFAPESADRDGALVDIKREFQDAMNRGHRPDVAGIVDERPELKDELAELSQYYNFIADALKPEFAGPAPEPVQEVVLSHFRLVTMHARHPLGGLFLGVDQHSNKHAELLVIRGQMSRARSSRLLREALASRDAADPGFVPVIDAGEVHDLKFVAWQYRAELTLERVIRRLRRSGGHRTLLQVVLEYEESSDPSKDPSAPADEMGGDYPVDAGARLLANPRHVAAVLDLVASAAEALDRAHLRGFLLLDVRPANVFVDRTGRARLRGFGLVQHARAAWHRLGSEVGFLAPEVLADDEPPLDWRADVYGVALLLYAALSLKDPPDFSTIEHRSERLFLDLRGAPQGVLPLVESALARDPAARLASCGLFAAELRRISAVLTGPPPAPIEPGPRADAPGVPPWVWYAFLSLILVVALTVALWAAL